ncbi:hypothetical protein ACF1CY_003321 [Providencia rettgeri]
MNQLKIDKQKQQYVFTQGRGVFPIGIALLAKRAKAVAQWMGVAEPKIKAGSFEHYTECMAIMEKGHQYAKRTGLQCSGNLSPQLVGYEGERVSVVDNAGHTRSFWVARTLGWMPSHLEVDRLPVVFGQDNEDDVLAAENYQSVVVIG